MCYAIPGKVINIDNNIVTVDYFGQVKKARNDFHELAAGDYIYAQGGFVIQKVKEEDALETLGLWQELFFKLKEVDLRLADRPKNIYQRANAIRQEHLGNSCCVHGIIEFSNYCRNNCLYCGLRKENAKIRRYRMPVEEIVESAACAADKLNFKALVLQSGEDLWFDEERLVNIVQKIMERSPVLLILSIGERDIELYKKLYEVGARGALLRFETSNPQIYEKYRPGYKLQDRLVLIRQLRQIGYLVFTGFLIGLPEQTEEDILNDLNTMGSLAPEMFSFGPFIPHPDTPLADSAAPDVELVLTTIARARIMYPESRILVTTALQTLDKENGAKSGLLCGGNSLMINVTPQKYSRLYEIYPDRAGIDSQITDTIKSTTELLHSIGRAPTDLGF